MGIYHSKPRDYQFSSTGKKCLCCWKYQV